ncbi:arylsulfotransferase [Brachyspira hampsonii 30446]|uniref:Arylsulfotransferase n=1 Tax=Brachyspira hampsonii 30446 TaxID=1289135 RepID=A0A2U4F0H2_9SPIR|nr:aryl-sulfate sulfotransferase [Brachyspira hampsonii]EKV57672.1 arylsulfotransferase [Brachyspira hampsonii 30446]MBW5394096.1 aryl sulfotransferase [Brachyspira hampsonii]OEJ20614.1 aryl sulfotransferase [Brachyspira hampsonii]
MKKLLFTILLITGLFTLSCKDKVTSPLNNPIGITVNPNGTTPLSAVYTRETVNTAPITVTVKGLYGEPDIIHTYPAGYGREFEIHGMFAESQNTIEVNDGGRIITKNVYVASLQNGIQKKYDVSINNLPEEKYKNNPELYFIMAITYLYSIGISENGYVRYIQTGYGGTKLVIENKRMLLYPEISGKITDLLGKELIKYPTISHHDTIKVNGNYIYLSFSTWGSEDRLVEINSAGSKVRELSFGKLIQNSLDLEKYPEDEAVFKQIVFGEDVNNIYTVSGQQKSIDWFHGNSLVYDSSTDILYVSIRQRAVVAIDYSEWKLIWWMADETLATEVPGAIPYDVHFKDLKSLDAYRVKGDGMNDGPKNQHALFLLANGNLGMFDNQGDEENNPNGSRYVEYQITGTHGNYMAQKVYEYRDTSLYSHSMSDVDFTGDNYQNLLLAYADPKARILEVEKNTKNVLFRLDLPFMSYRADKMPLYYDEGRVYSEDCNLKNPN